MKPKKTKQIESRCQKILDDGECDAYTETLDYYTTQRVKGAFQRMNREGIVQRLQDVNRTMEQIRCVLMSVTEPYDLDVAEVTQGIPLDDAAADDRNVVCVPREEDFVFP